MDSVSNNNNDSGVINDEKKTTVQAQDTANLTSKEPSLKEEKNDILAALDTEFATSVTKVYVNSLDREVSFREITAKEQKSLTRITTANESRKDVTYDVQCALINKVCLDQNFDIYECSEFDRIKILLALYQANMFQNQVTFKCEECGENNTYTIDFDNVIVRLNSFSLEPKKFSYSNKSHEFEFICEYPTVRLVKKFHESYCKTHSGKVPRREIGADESIQKIEYLQLFIKSLTYKNKSTGKANEIVFDRYPISYREEIANKLPQDVFYSDNGILKNIVSAFIQPMNDSFDKHECWKCHTIHEKGNADQAESFF